MKLNITLGQPPLNGYLNIDPYYDHDGKVKCQIDQLDEHVDAAECEEILALDVLEYISAQKADDTLNHWISKLAHSGKITIGATNLRQVAKAIINKNIGLDLLIMMIYGEQKYDWEYKRGMVDLERLCNALQSKGLKILSKQLDNFKMYVTAERP